MSEPSQPGTLPKAGAHLPLWAAVLVFSALALFLGILGWGLVNGSARGLAVGDGAPDFTLTTFDGQEFDTRSLRGKVVLVNFWASWCDTCDEEALSLEQAWQVYQDAGDVIFLGVAYVDTEAQSLRFMEQYGVSFPNGPDLRSSISDLYAVTGVPETYIMDRNGRLAYVKIGPFTSLEEIRAVIDPLLLP
jgi:cytochrome c biogenesis protein CcmG, thiol:disulfide interchange protein DsbE